MLDFSSSKTSFGSPFPMSLQKLFHGLVCSLTSGPENGSSKSVFESVHEFFEGFVVVAVYLY